MNTIIYFKVSAKLIFIEKERERERDSIKNSELLISLKYLISKQEIGLDFRSIRFSFLLAMKRAYFFLTSSTTITTKTTTTRRKNNNPYIYKKKF